jgi:prolyl oligopeptidase
MRVPRPTLAVLASVSLLACGGGSQSSPLPVESPPAMTSSPAPAEAAHAAAAKPRYPATKRDDVVDEIHGVRVADPYRWLEDATRPEVKAWMATQHEFARAHLDAAPRRAEIEKRLGELLRFDANEVPRQRGNRLFWKRRLADNEKRVLVWRTGTKGAEKVLLDPNTWTTDGSVSLDEWWPSPDGSHVVYQRQVNNSDEAVLHVIDVATGKDTGDVIPGGKYGDVEWLPNGRGFYYTWIPPLSAQVTVADRPGFAEVRYHKLGGSPAKDPTVFPSNKDPQTFVKVKLSDDGRWLVTEVSHGSAAASVELYLKDRLKKNAAWQPIVKGVAARYEVFAGAGRQFFVFTNEGAPNYRVFALDPTKPARADWKEVVPEGKAAIDTIEVAGGHIVLSLLQDASAKLEVRTFGGALAHTLVLPGIGAVDEKEIHGKVSEDALYFEFQSFTERSIILKASMKSGAVTEWSKVTLPVDPSQMVSEQVRFTSKDGTSVPMFLVYKKGMVRDGKNPTILYGYGGFNQPMRPTPIAGNWGWPWAAWIEQGGVLAWTNLRGGNEYGEAWHEAGMRLKKQNTFDDFLAAGRWLIDNKVTAPQHMAAMGRSNGGLLVGAAMTQAPEMFQVIVCGVPLLDMVRYHLFGSGKTWIAEYGSVEDPEQAKAIMAYSPQLKVKDGVAYPTLLMLAADADDRVDPMHARKFVAAVQHASSSSNPALLRIEKAAGHTGGDVVKATIAGGTDTFAFLLQQLGGPR